MNYFFTSLFLFPFVVVCAEEKESADSIKSPAISKPADRKPFPKHWGEPPRLQTRDLRPLPHGFGMGSSTLASWILKNVEADKKRNPKPAPPKKPLPLPKIEDNISLQKKIEKELHRELKKKIESLGKNPDPKKIQEASALFRKEHAARFEDLADLRKQMHKLQKDRRPVRAEPSPEIKAKIVELETKRKAVHKARVAFQKELKGKSKAEVSELLKEFKKSQQGKLEEVKAAHKALIEAHRRKVQKAARRE